VTAFFVGGSQSPNGVAEQAYQELRQRSQELAGCPARLRRIFKLSCRLDGRDRSIEVGRPLSQGGDVVAAIMDHGRDEAYVVHTAEAEGGMAAPVRVRSHVYSVTEFS
jgi:hypothetical protein